MLEGEAGMNQGQVRTASASDDKKSPVKRTNLFVALGVLSLALGTGFALARAETFRITGSQNLATVQSQTSVENFVGRTNKVSGELSFDQSAKTGSGTVTVEGTTIQTGNAVRDGHMRSAQWMNFEKFPEIKFETTKVTHTKGDEYNVAGKLSMSGQTKDITTTATLRFLPASDATKQLGYKGDVVNLRTTFDVKLSTFNVKIPAQAASTVSDSQRIQINVFASNQ
jgi:polyisoprenoid-binding protein YceI